MSVAQVSATSPRPLRKGLQFEMAGHHWRVAYVNLSRAHCVATVKQPVTRTNRADGTTRTFHAARRITIDISPTSAVELLQVHQS